MGLVLAVPARPLPPLPVFALQDDDVFKCKACPEPASVTGPRSEDIRSAQRSCWEGHRLQDTLPTLAAAISSSLIFVCPFPPRGTSFVFSAEGPGGRVGRTSLEGGAAAGRSAYYNFSERKSVINIPGPPRPAKRFQAPRAADTGQSRTSLGPGQEEKCLRQRKGSWTAGYEGPVVCHCSTHCK